MNVGFAAKGAKASVVSCGLLMCGLVSAGGQGVGYWHTSANRILDANGTQVRIAGINWYGFETTNAVVGGLNVQDYKAILNTIKNNGYNTIRMPFSSQMIETPSSNLSISYSNGMNSDLQGLNSLQVMDKLVTYAGTVGLKIILDNHRSTAGGGPQENGLWYSGSYTEQTWINDWTMLANRYLNNPTVVGFDLRNEPHNAASGGSCWDCGGATDWHLAAERAGNAVLGVNPKLLIFVEGTDEYNNDYYWWGGNLEGVRNSPVTLSVANQLVYSAHDYGPSVYGQSWFNGSTTYASLSSVWTNHWAFIDQGGIAPVWLGEFGTGNNNSDAQNSAAGSEGQWFQSLVAYLQGESTLSWTYWALNGEDSLALLDGNYDSTPANGVKQSLLAGIQFPLKTGGGTTAPVPVAPGGLAASAVSANQVNLSWTASSTTGVTYTIYFGTSSGSTATPLASGVSGTSYQATALNASTTYYFTVKAIGAGGSSAGSNQASATTQAAVAPGAPSGLTATAVSSTQINLSWQASATAGVTYAVYRGTSSGPTAVLSSGVSGTSYQATALNASTTYYFTVKAVGQSGTSGASNQASAVTQAAVVPGAPSGLTATAVSSTQINLSWQASATAGVTYTVSGGTSSGPTAVLSSGVSATSYQAAGLNASTTYYFTVKAVGQSGTSGASNQASVVTQAAPAGGCHIAYLDQNDWGTGFTGNISITNNGPAISSWTLAWSYGGNQQLNQSWNGNYTQSGHTVTISNASWNGSIAAGSTLIGVGFNAGYNGTNTNPVTFSLNGVACH